LVDAELNAEARVIELASEYPHGTRLWQVDLDSYATLAPLDGLSSVEHQRARSMAFDRDARRYLASRHALRRALSVVTGALPQDIRIDADVVGKPCCPDLDVQFNISHSGRWGLIGIGTSGLAIGVDVEIVRSIPEVHALASSHFSPTERQLWSNVPEKLRDATFFALWVRKEACLKALGVGLAAEPSSINVSETLWTPKVDVPLGENRCEVSVYALEIAGEVTAAMALAEVSSVARARQYYQAS